MSAFRIARSNFEPTPKSKPAKSKSYLAFIHELPSAISGVYGVEAAHLSFANTLFCHYGRAKGHKASDAWAIPLTPDEHSRQHQMGEEAFWRETGINPHATAAALWMAYSTLGDEAVQFATARINQGLALASRLRERIEQ